MSMRSILCHMTPAALPPGLKRSPNARSAEKCLISQASWNVTSGLTRVSLLILTVGGAQGRRVGGAHNTESGRGLY